MNIKKIVIADDESIQRSVLSCIIRKITLSQIEIEACANGKEAYEKIREGETDLLITDIRMPIMDGMDLIALVSKEFPKVKIILISAYQDFEYAKSAISCGVSEYLVKPFRSEEIKRMLCKLEEEVGQLRKTAKTQNQYEDLLSQLERDNRKKILSALLNGQNPKKELPQPVAAALSWPGTTVLVRWITRLHTQKNPQGQPCLQGLSVDLQERLLKKLRLLFPNGLFVPQEKGIDVRECRVALLLPGWDADACKQALDGLAAECALARILFWAGISACQDDLLTRLFKSMQQANEVLPFYFYCPLKSGIFSYSDMCGVFKTPMLPLAGYENHLREAMHNGKSDQLAQRLEGLKERLLKGSLPHPSKVKHRVSSMVVSIIRDLEGMISQQAYDELLNDAYSLYGGCAFLEELFSISLNLLARASAYFTQESGQYDAVEDVIAYIKVHFKEELSLSLLAHRVHFSANYLSMQIKKKTGMSYVSYLTQLRTSYASQLLLETARKVADIGTECGYPDSSYFNRIFCRKFGLSPEQYRKVHKKCQKN